MPIDYLKPCLECISYITKYLRSEAIFLTATMPDFKGLINKYSLANSKITDLIDNRFNFKSFKKCKFKYIGKQTQENLVLSLNKFPSSLIIVNSKKNAKKYMICLAAKNIIYIHIWHIKIGKILFSK